MTRDGAVEINETQQTAERISNREADSDFSQPDTATAERVMEHLDAAHTRKASKKAVKKAQEAAVLRTSTSRLQFTDEERETPKLQPYIKKSEKAADKLIFIFSYFLANSSSPILLQIGINLSKIAY